MSVTDSNHHGFQFHLLSRLYFGRLVKSMEKHGLSRGFLMLLRVSENDGKLSQNQISREFLIDKVSANRTTKYLVDKGLLIKEVCPSDRRKSLLFLTNEGKQMVPNIEEALRQTNAWFLADLNPEEVKVLSGLHKKLKDTCTQDLDLL